MPGQSVATVYRYINMLTWPEVPGQSVATVHRYINMLLTVA